VRRSWVVGLSIILVLGSAAPAWAQSSVTAGGDSEAFVVLTGPANVPADTQVGDLVVFHGSSTVDGTVDGSLTAFDAPVTISGRVNGDVIVFNGSVTLRSGAIVTGDVMSQDEPVVESGATIGGETRRIQTNFDWDGFGWVGRLIWWLAISVSTFVVGLLLLWLAGRGSTRIAEAGSQAIGPSIGWGALLFFGLPILAIVSLVTIVGLPFGIVLLAALGLIYALGYAAAAWVLGRRLVREPTAWILAFLAGWGILRLVAFIPVLGALVGFAATVFGLGALTVAVWRSRTVRQAAPAVAP